MTKKRIDLVSLGLVLAVWVPAAAACLCLWYGLP